MKTTSTFLAPNGSVTGNCSTAAGSVSAPHVLSSRTAFNPAGFAVDPLRPRNAARSPE